MRILRSCQFLLSLTVVLTAHALIIARASAREIGRFGDFTVQVSDQNWCSENVGLEILAGVPSAFIENRADLERSVGLARAALSLDCPRFVALQVQGVAEGITVYSGVAREIDSWRLVSIPLTPDSVPSAHTAVHNASPHSSSAVHSSEAERRTSVPAGVGQSARSIAYGDPGVQSKAACGDQQLYDEDGSLTTTDRIVGYHYSMKRGRVTPAPITAAELKRKYPLPDRIGIWGGRTQGEYSILKQQEYHSSRCAAATFLEMDRPCDTDDLQCQAVADCPSRDAACVRDRLDYWGSRFQGALVATIRHDPVNNLLPFARFVVYRPAHIDGKPDDWCGQTLGGELNYPLTGRFPIDARAAKSVESILDQAVSNKCPSAERIALRVTTLDFKRAPFAIGEKISGKWNVKIRPDWGVTGPQNNKNRSPLDVILSTDGSVGSIVEAVTQYALDQQAAVDDAQRKRMVRYVAEEGKVCAPRASVAFCYTSENRTNTLGPTFGRTTTIQTRIDVNSSCAAPCSGHDGYCDMSSGRKFTSLEAAERDNCRAATSQEKEAILSAAKVTTATKPWPYQLNENF